MSSNHQVELMSLSFSTHEVLPDMWYRQRSTHHHSIGILSQLQETPNGVAHDRQIYNSQVCAPFLDGCQSMEALPEHVLLYEFWHRWFQAGKSILLSARDIMQAVRALLLSRLRESDGCGEVLLLLFCCAPLPLSLLQSLLFGLSAMSSN